MVEKAKALTNSGARKTEYGEAGKYINFTDKTCCLLPVIAANWLCVIFSAFRKLIISPISLYSSLLSFHALANVSDFFPFIIV